jgi:hypothetical protein
MDKACHINSLSPRKEKTQLAIEYILTEDQQHIMLVNSNIKTLTQENILNYHSTSNQTIAIALASKKSKKVTMGLNHILIYEGDEDPKLH